MYVIVLLFITIIIIYKKYILATCHFILILQ